MQRARLALFGVCLMLASLALPSLAAPRWDFSDYPSSDPAKLFQIAFDSDSVSEKLRIRSWLAAKHADSPEGTFARAWMASYEGDNKTSQVLYQECMRRYPKFAGCLVNGINSEIEGKVNLGVGDRVAQMDPRDIDPDANVYLILNTFVFLNEVKKDRTGANAFLAKYRASYPISWGLDFVEGRNLKEGHEERKAALFRSAIAKGKSNVAPEVFSRLIALETGALYEASKGSRFDVASQLVIQFYQQTRNFKNDSLIVLLHDDYLSQGADRMQLIKQFNEAGVQISSELLDGVTGTSARNHPAWFEKLRRQQTERAKFDPTLNYWLAQMAIAADDNPNEAKRLFRLAVDGAYSNKQRESFGSTMIWNLVIRGDCEVADNEAKSLLERYSDLGKSAKFYTNWFEAQVCTGDLVGARTSQNQLAALGQKSSSMLGDEARLVMLEAESKRPQSGDAFLRDWQASSGGRLSLQIEFATGLAQIPARFEPMLKQVADALKQSGAASYVFEVAGHTDNTGNAQMNKELSQKRAQAVVDYLIQRHGLSSLKLRATGYGQSFPMADNLSEAGKQKNRRVEVTPVSSAASPSIAVAGKPNPMRPTLSNDGRLLLDGNSVLWDTRQWIALRQLPDQSQAAFSRDGRYVIGLSTPQVASMNASIWVYELASNNVIGRRLLKTKSSVESFALSPDGKRLATVRDGYLEIYGLPKLSREGILQLSPLMVAGVATWVGNDRIAAGLRYGGETLKLVNANTLKVDKQFEEADYTHTVGTSASGRYLVATVNSGALYTWDTQTWQRREIPKERWFRYSREFKFHPFREQMVADQWNGSSAAGPVIVDLETLQVSKEIPSTYTKARATYTPDGEELYVQDVPTLSKRNVRTGESNHVGAPDAPTIYNSRTEKRDGLLATLVNGESFKFKYLIWDIVTARPKHTMGDIRTQVAGAPNQYWNENREGMLELHDLNTFQTSVQGSRPSAYKDWDGRLTANRWVFTRALEKTFGDKKRAKEAELAIVDRQSGREMARHKFFLATEDFIYSRDEYPLETSLSIALSPDGRYVAVGTNWKEHWGYPARNSKIVQIFDLQNGQRIKELRMSKPVERVEFVPEQAGILLVRTDGYVNRYQVAKDTFVNGYAIDPADVVLYDDGQRRFLRNNFYVYQVLADDSSRVLPVSGTQSGMVLPDRNLLLLIFEHEIRYYDLKTLSHQLTVVARDGGEWIAYTPDGHFSASPKGTDGLYWSLGEATLPFSALKEKFDRPEMVRERLQRLFQGEATAVAPVQVIDSSASAVVSSAITMPVAATPGTVASPTTQLDTVFFDPPFKLRILEHPKTIDTASLTLKVGITKTRASDLEPAIELNVNGQQIEARGLARLEGTGANCVEGGALKVGCETIRNLPLSLEEGRNVVIVNAFFKGGRAQPEVVAIERKKAVTSGPLPSLWYFGVGVSEYNDPRNNLQFAHRDAEALAAAFAKQEGKLYAKVNAKVLLNKSAGAREVLSEMNRFLRQASSQDLIVIFLAGHGMQDNNQTLYFMTADSNLEEAFTGLGVSELQSFLRRRPMSQKALLLLDICHAGAAAGNMGRRGVPTGNDVINQLVNGTGVKVLASSQGQEYSLEQADFRGGHGAFTAALLEALEGKAKSGAGSTSVLELEHYVSKRVPELTKGKQHPTAPDSNNFQDYPLAVH